MENIRLLVTSDVHSYIYPYKYHDNKEASLGLAKCVSVFKKYSNDHTLILDNGDVLQGSPLSFYHGQLENPGIHPMTTAMNLAGYDYINVGNHDFNYGEKALRKHLDGLNMPCITANVLDDNKVPLGCTYVVHSFDNGIKLALFGLVTQYIPNWEQPDHIEHFEFKDAYETAKEIVERIKKNEKVDYIVCLYHGGYERDLVTGRPTENLTGENEGYQLCSIPGIDMVLSGHQHRSFSTIVKGKVTTQTGANGVEVAMVEINPETREITSCLIPADEEADTTILEALKEEEKACQKWLDIPVGHCLRNMKVKDEFEARLHKHPIISYFNQVQKEITGADISANALFMGATGFNETVTVRDIVSTYVYPNTFVVKKVTGKILKEYLEKSAEYWTVNGNEIGVNPIYDWPKPQHFNYDMVDGIEYTIKVSNPVGSRIIDLTYEGLPVTEDQVFNLALNNYRASGGGDYEMIANAPVVKELSTDMVEGLIKYITANPEITCDHKDNIKVIL